MSQSPNKPNSEEIRGGQQLMISLVRLSGLLFLAGGALIASGFFAALEPAIGYVLVIVGFVDLIILPTVMQRMFTKASDNFLAGNRPDNPGGR